jgi:hypothetical protein
MLKFLGFGVMVSNSCGDLFINCFFDFARHRLHYRSMLTNILYMISQIILI